MPKRDEDFGFITKDSGERQSFDSGMVRDLSKGKPRFDLITPLNLPYEEQFLTRWAMLMARGAEKYGDRNWEKADSLEELNRARESAYRHHMQWFFGETDEDHGVAVAFNMSQVDLIKWKMRRKRGSK